MVKTRTISKKSGNRCPMCAGRFGEDDAWSNHLVECGNRQRQLKRFECPGCDYAAVKKCDLDRHQRRFGHSEPQQASDSEGEWEEQDPGYLLAPQAVKQEPDWSVTLNQENGDLSEDVVGSSNGAFPCSPLEEKRDIVCQASTVRKRASSLSGIATKPKIAKPSSDFDSSERTENLKHNQLGTTGVHGLNFGTLLVDASTQTDAPIKNVTKKRTVTYQKKGKTIVEVTEEHWTEY
ncbi:uncharacterized protein LOC110453169 [Mizuhopecten yessoensis]|uniref:C2H2-type domain-containing protein n=1 Tax=Mizuhopecten yessoensis TaxID=6573 RepID=A0A210QHV4_MIZYE|nr:uncharacterized protein LOC110453169 [Mizuhopecten yessoensis]OWF48368.1 hypothetical protein KP79_PYT18718 [Mizuhopecten yessoensis]